MTELELSVFTIPQQRGVPLADLLEARQRIAEQVVMSIRRLRLLDVSWGEIARQLGMPKTTIYRQFKHVDGWDIGLRRDGRFVCMGSGIQFGANDEDLALTSADRMVLGEWVEAQDDVVGTS